MSEASQLERLPAMIRYALKCSSDHGFDSWFASAGAYDELAAAGRLQCPVCGDAEVTKSLMAPAARLGRTALAPEETEAKLRAFRSHIEAVTEHVGPRFAVEARAIHEGTAPDRPIRGEARIEEARALLADGIAVAPLPFMPSRKVN